MAERIKKMRNLGTFEMIKMINLITKTLFSTVAAVSVAITEAQGNSPYLAEDSKSM